MTWNPIWQQAEDSFLRHFCTIEQFKWGSRYFWESGKDWAKFNFIRISQPDHLPKNLENFVTQNEAWFNARNRTLNIKVPLGVANISIFNQEFCKAGIPIVSLELSKNDAVKIQSDYELIQCQNSRALEIWWNINSAGRSRADPLESPLWPVLLKALRAGTEFFYLCKDGIPSTCVAVDEFNGYLNFWGLATIPTMQKRCLSKAIIQEIFALKKIRVFCQVDKDGITDVYFRSLPGTTVLMEETRYVPKKT